MQNRKTKPTDRKRILKKTIRKLVINPYCWKLMCLIIKLIIFISQLLENPR